MWCLQLDSNQRSSSCGDGVLPLNYADRGMRTACKPGSVEGRSFIWANHCWFGSSNNPKASRGQRSTAFCLSCYERGLPQRNVSVRVGVSYTAVSSLPDPCPLGLGHRRFVFCCTVLSGCPARPLAGALSYVARTFLCNMQRSSSHPHPGANEGNRTPTAFRPSHSERDTVTKLRHVGMVPSTGIEPALPCGNNVLNVASLPRIPPRWHGVTGRSRTYTPFRAPAPQAGGSA